ncbi:diaminobutyrate--2-oxoglutarate transaminase [Leucobacter sp. wl10]|uniref:diaminobutyrate--2-oxoglutarate transaminase n=1 Tax=Leucobacter sp. wl10 TaxID=2304677 RepID=UPI000E5AA599|nr:diaminobutyrate--2-oxoglutarate transaminase [Leucobacter sp. wl10]RGE22038.1 aminotransferase class III-fold pyridoxal phosphate-dependent enzyme [Leucobacter sp. wl10]
MTTTDTTNRQAGLTVETFERRESNVRMYCRDVPIVFDTAQGTVLRGEDGREYLDFFAGAGALNYGHNDPRMRDAIIGHLRGRAVVHGLDLFTRVKRELLETIEQQLLGPRDLDYRVQFTGPTGADANEAALKLARKATGRSRVVAFNGGYHGMTAGAYAVSGGRSAGKNFGSLTHDVTFVPFEDGPHGEFDSLGFLRRLVEDRRSGTDVPAAVIVEAVQIQAGVFGASAKWLRDLRDWTREHGIVLILDEVQAGCGRTGQFFSFERSGIVPDIVTTAKSISGFGLPMALNLIAPALDVWEPGEHTGTFRGNQLSFVTARIALAYWTDPAFLELVSRNCATMNDAVTGAHGREGFIGLPGVESARVRGLIAGVDFGLGNADAAHAAQRRALEAGVLVERCGPNGEVIKLMPPINTPTERLVEGLQIIGAAINR